jgi:hypothetical protein
MINMILTALLAAGLSGVGTYAVMQRAPPSAPYDALAIERLNTRIDQLVALQQQQLVGIDRQIMLGRLMVRATTGSDPLPILQQAGK